jgi:TorA maturation chaperone TorD
MELFRALAVFAEPPDRLEVAALARLLDLGETPSPSDYTETFVFQLPPYASVYLGAEGMLGGEARDRVAGFFKALGQTPTAEPDHLTALLATYAELSARGDGDSRRHESMNAARKAFLWEHILSWLHAYLDKLSEIAPTFYGRWAKLLFDALLEEAAALGRQDALPLHLREAAKVADPRSAKAEEFLQTLLAPVRSGLILTRADLARGARALGAGLRAGERRVALKSLLGQDAPGALAWLAGEAAHWTKRHAQYKDALGEVAAWWARRAEATATLLRELMADAHEAK